MMSTMADSDPSLSMTDGTDQELPSSMTDGTDQQHTSSSSSIAQNHRSMFKHRNMSTLQTRRRVALERQKNARREAQHAARLAHLINQVDSETPSDSVSVDQNATSLPRAFTGSATPDAVNRRGFEQTFSSQLQIAEWMIDIPTDLYLKWYVMARPEGDHCVVVSSNGHTVARKRTGQLMLQFQSLLPNGSQGTLQNKDDYCVLDCIFNSEQETLYVIDIMCWKGYPLYDCSTDMRFFWAQSRLSELGSLEQSTGKTNEISIVLTPFYDSTLEGIQTAYEVPKPYPKDGLLFYNKESNYVCGLSPLVLKWKDQNCSKYSGTIATSNQFVTLKLREDYKLEALGGEILGEITAEFAAEKQFKPHSLGRFGVTGVIVREPTMGFANDEFHHGNHNLGISLQGLYFVSTVNEAGAIASSVSKIAFEYMSRNNSANFAAVVSEVKRQQEASTMDVVQPPPFVP